MKSCVAKVLVFSFAVLLAPATQAYIGPGAGLSALGSALALIGAVLLMIVGFIWYPVKRLLKGKKRAATSPEASESTEANAAGTQAEMQQSVDHSQGKNG